MFNAFRNSTFKKRFFNGLGFNAFGLACASLCASACFTGHGFGCIGCWRQRMVCFNPSCRKSTQSSLWYVVNLGAWGLFGLVPCVGYHKSCAVGCNLLLLC